MGTKAGAAIEYCEHDELRAACLECLAMPQKVAPQPTAAPRATKNPSSESDKISPLGGDLDMSLPVDAVDPMVGADWLSAHTFPHYLRRSGWIYLRCNGVLEARVKAVKVIWRAERKVPTSEAYEDRGPGLAIQVDPRTWDTSIAIDLGAHAERQQHGYRYLMTNDDDTVTHYRGGRPVADTGDYDDEIRL
ncbi:MAG: hypothetical protein OEV40_20265 [Acidimicrobiia bacterium]|nr:hypothetical protein [Acidimicrobiia bacterium]